MSNSWTGLSVKGCSEYRWRSVGCTSKDCVFGHPGGIHTEGRCDCIRNLSPSHDAIDRYIRTMRKERDKLRDALSELYALAMGECPSLLDEDSGGCAELEMECSRLLDRDCDE